MELIIQWRLVFSSSDDSDTASYLREHPVLPNLEVSRQQNRSVKTFAYIWIHGILASVGHKKTDRLSSEM